ncbi:hypothetical protein WR25_24767 [Diploscapter pachys]|uniref:ShKT domain-containing protein n=1 Tax=Diploscapter pachys TaxID=2018661 RepID=A0A2A2KWI0_9BILA|nr:hypothetical protein WR25_24767 [Diploscapter pachys]
MVQTWQLAFSPLSVKCNDKLTSAQCLKIYVDAAVVPDLTTATRPTNYCCLTDAYKCANKQNPAINCDTITDGMCNDPIWRQQISDNWYNMQSMHRNGWNNNNDHVSRGLVRRCLYKLRHMELEWILHFNFLQQPTEGAILRQVVFAASALKCSDKAGTTACKKLFTPGTPIVVGLDTPDRVPLCFNNAGTATGPVTEDIKQVAIAYCANTCGYCCQTPPYACKNKENPSIDCAKVTDGMCEDPTWRQQISDNWYVCLNMQSMHRNWRHYYNDHVPRGLVHRYLYKLCHMELEWILHFK